MGEKREERGKVVREKENKNIILLILKIHFSFLKCLVLEKR